MNKFKNKKSYILIALFLVLSVSSVFMTIETATSGMEVAKLQKQEAVLLAQKRDLQESLVKTLSVSELSEKSSDLGFVKPENLVYVSSVETASLPETVAKLP